MTIKQKVIKELVIDVWLSQDIELIRILERIARKYNI